jgi:hypothetical protein
MLYCVGDGDAYVGVPIPTLPSRPKKNRLIFTHTCRCMCIYRCNRSLWARPRIDDLSYYTTALSCTACCTSIRYRLSSISHLFILQFIWLLIYLKTFGKYGQVQTCNILYRYTLLYTDYRRYAVFNRFIVISKFLFKKNLRLSHGLGFLFFVTRSC